MPPQIFWHSLKLLPLVAVLGLALVVAVFWLYPAQVRGVRWPWRWVLPALRAVGLLVLAASLLQPVAQRLRRPSERGTVLILVDRSKSMSVTDLSRTPAQLVALADGLGRLPAGLRSGAAADLSTQLEHLRGAVADVVAAGNDVETAEAFGRGVNAAAARLGNARAAFDGEVGALAAHALKLPDKSDVRARITALKSLSASHASRQAWAADARNRIDAADVAAKTYQSQLDRSLYESNATVKSVCDELARSSRWSLAEQAVLRPQTGLVPRIGDAMPVALSAVAESVLPTKAAGEHLSAAPDGTGSNLAGAVTSALAESNSRPLRAVVLLSEGRQVGGDPTIVSGLSPAGAPVFTVCVAPAQRPPDLAFARDLSAPSRAFVGETIAIRATLASTGLPPAPADVQLKAGEVVQSQHVDLQANATAAVEFSLRLEHGGPQRIVLSVPPVPGEITTENNVVERWIQVLPERVKVAAYGATAGRDFQLLRGTLARTPWVRLESGVLDAVKPKLPLKADQILAQDVIVLSDVPVDALDDVQWDAVNRLVRERGGSLFMLAGPDHLPASYTPAAIVPSSLLPYDPKSVTPSWRTWPGAEPAFRFVPASPILAEQADALRLGPGAGSLRQWQSLGGAFRFMPVPELNAKLNARALLVEADSHLPVLTESSPGSGRVLFLGTDETWRWRYKVGGRDFDRFWRQLIRYAAGEPYAAQRNLLALDTDMAAAAPGEPITVRARVLSGDADAYRVELLRAAGGAVVQRQMLSQAGMSGGGRFTCTATAPPDEGDYTVRLFNPSDDSSVATTLELPLHVAASSEAEMADVSGDEAFLRRIADASGGQFLPLERINELPALLAAAGEGRSQYSQWLLWDSPLLFVFVVACFGGEWALRKRVGLA